MRFDVMQSGIRYLSLIATCLCVSYCSSLDRGDSKNLTRPIEFTVNNEYRVSFRIADGPVGIHVDRDFPVSLSPGGEFVIFNAFYDRRMEWRNRDIHYTSLTGALFRVDGYSKNQPLLTTALLKDFYRFPEDANIAVRLAEDKIVSLGGREWLSVKLVGKSSTEGNTLVLRPPGAAYTTVIGTDYVFMISVVVDEKFASNAAKLSARLDALEAVVREVKITRVE